MLTQKIRAYLNNHRSEVAAFAVLTLAAAGCAGSSSVSGANKFTLTKLVADTAGPASHTDANLLNAWGMAASPGGPWWISDNGKGVATVYGGDGTINSLVVNIPGAGGAPGGPVTGQVYNNTTGFVVTGLGPSKFIFVTEDGVLSAWYAGATAVVESDQSGTGAVYKGLAIAANGSNTFLYAANFRSGMIDVFDTTFAKTTSFTDPGMAPGYAPFGITTINGLLYVTYAKQDAAKHDDVKGTGFGYVDVFNTDGTLNKRLISNGNLNAPWGLALAPSSFGVASGALLVGNFGDGKINAYSLSTGNFVATLNDSTGTTPLTIDGLWGIAFGNGTGAGATTTLFFTAGPNSEANGLFGSIVVSP